MCQSVRTYLLLGSLLICFILPSVMSGQQYFPSQVGEKVRYSAMIEMPQAYISGICIIIKDSSEIKGSIFNEFGVSAIDFSYIDKKEKVKLHHVMGVMNKWYIRRLLKKDLRSLIKCLQKGIGSYRNEKYSIIYSLSPINIEEYEATE